jgi:RNA polymerase I-specific transcription initiation factor RRN3
MEELEEKIAEQGEAPVEVFDIDPFDTVVGEEPPAVAEQEDEDETEDLSDISSEAPSIDDEDLVVEPPGMDIPHIKDMVGKLDSVLKLIFEHFSQSHRSDPPILTKSRSAMPTSTGPASPVKPTRDGSPESLERGKAARRAQFNTLLKVFDRTILRTFKSRYTQFLVFWYASLDPDFSDLFQGMLIDRALLDASKSQVERAAAASYLASFVSRASFVGRDSARDVVDFLCGFMQNHLDIVDQWLKLGELPAGQHGHFYSVAQAVFLIFCFRWRDLLEIEDQPEDGEPDMDGDVAKDDVVGLVGLSSAGPPGKKWMASLQVMQRVVTSTLNPLKVCRYI